MAWMFPHTSTHVLPSLLMEGGSGEVHLLWVSCLSSGENKMIL